MKPDQTAELKINQTAELKIDRTAELKIDQTAGQGRSSPAYFRVWDGDTPNLFLNSLLKW